MGEKTKKVLTVLFAVLIFVVSLILTVVGQRKVGPAGLGMMLVGLAGLIFLLWFYNRQYK